MLDSVLSVLALGSLAMAAYALGRPILRRLAVTGEDRLSVAVWSVGLGLIAAGLVLLGLGWLGGLSRPAIGVLTMAGCFWGLGDILRGYLGARRQSAPSRHDRPCGDQCDETPHARPAWWLFRGILAAAGLACLGSLLGALAPPSGSDVPCGRLELAKTFLAEHRVFRLPDCDDGACPSLPDLWYVWGLTLQGGMAARLTHWGLEVLLALATVVLATPLLGWRWARLAGALIVLAPEVSRQAAASSGDVALATFSTLALAGWYRAVVDDQGHRWFILAGLAMAGAVAISTQALVFAAAATGSWIWFIAGRPERRRFLLQGAAIVTPLALGVGGWWCLTGSWQPTPGCFGNVILLAAVPGVLCGRRLRGLGVLLGVALGYGLLWLLLSRQAGLLLPAVPLLVVATVWVWIEMLRFPRWARRVAAAALASLLAAAATGPLRDSHGQLAVALGLEDREQYLLRCDPTWPAAAVANRLLSPNAHILSQEDHTFHFERRITRENVFRRRTHYDRHVTDPAQLSHQLRAAGFTHLLLAETLDGQDPHYDSTLGRLADAQRDTGNAALLVPLTEYLHYDAEGTIRRYRLIMLGD